MFNQPQNFTSILIPFPLTSFDNDRTAGLCLDLTSLSPGNSHLIFSWRLGVSSEAKLTNEDLLF